jgi:hypothetical protein
MNECRFKGPGKPGEVLIFNPCPDCNHGHMLWIDQYQHDVIEVKLCGIRTEMIMDYLVRNISAM